MAVIRPDPSAPSVSDSRTAGTSDKPRAVGYLGGAPEVLRAGLIQGLRTRAQEIEDTVLTCVNGVTAPQGSESSDYKLGTREVVAAMIDHCLEGLAREAEWFGPLPAVVSQQAARAARGGVGVDTLVRRIFAGHALLQDILLEEAERVGLVGYPTVTTALRAAIERLFELFTAAVTVEYDRERNRLAQSQEQRRLELARRMLAGEEVDTGDLHYQFQDDMWHVAVIAVGDNAGPRVGAVAARLGLQLLIVSREPDVVWAWLGARRELPMVEIEGLLLSDESRGVRFAIGIPKQGLVGWRETHELAEAASLVLAKRTDRLIRCSDTLLEAALLARPALAKSLVQSYLVPLNSLRIGGETARMTLRAYLDCERSVSSAANKLGVSRPALEKRLAQIDATLAKRVAKCTAEIELALRVEALTV